MNMYVRVQNHQKLDHVSNFFLHCFTIMYIRMYVYVITYVHTYVCTA